MLLGLLLALVSGGALRAACGLALALLLPGYALAAAAFPGKDDLEPLERLAVSFGLSVATAVLVGLGLSYTPWGAKLLPILLSALPETQPLGGPASRMVSAMAGAPGS
jgi:uncharacterized membrane protein